MESVKQKPKKKPTKIEEMTKEQIRQAILKKRECNAKAQTIVEALLEKCITAEDFLSYLPDINQSHFEDIIEERSIIHLCGYPLCQENLSEKDIPKQQYRISVKTNKVYDITARKNFCSNSCYKAAMYVKKQMLTSPLWFREYEDIPKFRLLPLDSAGSMGQEVDVALVNRIKLKSDKRSFTSYNDFASATFNEMTDEDQENKDANQNVESQDSLAPVTSNNVDEITGKLENMNVNTEENKTDTNKSKTLETQKEDSEKKNIKRKNKEPVKSNKKPVPNPLNIVGEVVERPEKTLDPILIEKPEKITPNKQNTKPIQKKQPLVTVIIVEVEKSLAEWFTIDTLLFLFGEAKVKEMVADKGECIKEYLNNYAKSIFYNSNTYDQYQALCRKLNMLELEDRKYDAQTLQRETKPLPDYSILQEESKKMQLKVRAFFSGETEVPEVDTVQEKKPETDDVNVTQLPLVDKNAQNALRRRIVCQHLNKVLPDLLRSLGLLSLSISSDVRLLVNTFKLKANNIMFKPLQWTLIAIVFIKLLSLRDQRLEHLLQQSTTYQHMQLLLLSYKQDGGYLDRLISWLTDVDRLLDTTDTQLTIE